MRSRWDHLYDLKPVPLTEHFLEEASKLLAQDLAKWPPEVEGWATPADQARFGPLVAEGSTRPDDAVFTAAFALARLELEREFEQIDDYMRNERWRAVTPPGTGVEQLLFLTRFLTEQMLGIAEATEGRIKRPMLVDLLSRLERRLAERRALT